jgi:hypothetical protein
MFVGSPLRTSSLTDEKFIQKNVSKASIDYNTSFVCFLAITVLLIQISEKTPAVSYRINVRTNNGGP